MPPRCSISVALCTFNGARYLREQLTSICKQSRLPDEIVVCDDGSTDGSVELARELLGDSSVPFRIERNPERLGVSRNFEQAIRLCRHEIVAFSDQDDVWRPHKLETLAKAFEREPQVSCVFSNASVIDDAGKPLDYTQWDSVLFSARVRRKQGQELLPVLLRYPVVCGATLAVRRDAALRCLPIGDEWLHDEWIALLCSATSSVRWVDAELVAYRVHQTQEVGAARLTLGRQLATAKRMDRAYFNRQVRRFERIVERLKAWTPPAPAEALVACEGKLAYLRQREAFFTGAANPWRVSTRLLLDGAHARFELGFKSWLVDLGHAYVFGRSADDE